MITRIIIICFEGYAGRYVRFCHLLEHAANEMMRPLKIVSPRSSTCSCLQSAQVS